MSSASYQTSNPAFTSGTIFSDWSLADRRTTTMTVQGTALKTLALLVVAVAAAAATWGQVGEPRLSQPIFVGSLIASLVFFFITMFKPMLAMITGPLYAASEGVLLGSISHLLNRIYPGIAIQAVSLTFATLLVMLFLYGTRIVRVTPRLANGIIAATGAICLVYLASFVMSLFGAQMPYIHGAGPIGIGFSLFVVGLAAFNLLLDFDYIERCSTQGAPKAMEWYGAFGLMVTLVWLYLEVLRLLAKFQSRD